MADAVSKNVFDESRLARIGAEAAYLGDIHMLLNTWLSVARRHFSCANPRRVDRVGKSRSLRTEPLEERMLLTALVINSDNQALFTNATGGLVINNAQLAGNDSLVIEGISIAASSGNAVSINLNGIALKSIAIESIIVSNYAATGIGFDINLTGVTTLHTIAIEDISMSTALKGRGIQLTLDNTDVGAVTIDDSVVPGVKIDAIGGADIAQGLISGNTIDAKANFEGILLNVSAGTADNFRIENNASISSPNRDFIKINAANSPMDGLRITDNTIGSVTQGAGVLFRAEGDTFLQPFTLTNSSTKNEFLQTFTFDIGGIGLEYDINGVSGKPFTALNNSGTVTGVTSSTVSSDKKILTVTFSDFAPGETLQFLIDIDIAGGTPASIFGDDLIGGDVTAAFSGNRNVSGQMIGDPAVLTASQFAIGPGVSGSINGINLLLSNAPLTNATISGNKVIGASSNGLLLDADTQSNVTGVITGNQFESSGRDGIRFDLQDSDFTGAVLGNSLSNNGGYGFAVLPRVTRSGLVQAALDNSPVIITSANHGLTTGNEIMIQGMVNHDPTVNHPANGLKTITRIDNNRFSLNGVNGTLPGVAYDGGGAWFKPEFQPDGSARGLVLVDMQTAVPGGTVRTASNAGPIVIESANHGLTTGQQIRVSNVRGNTAANGIFLVTVVDANTFRLNGSTGNGAYDTSSGFGTWTPNVITAASNAADIVITSKGHGLQSGDEIRVTGVQGNTAANGTFLVSVLSADTFRLTGVNGNGAYATGGNWVSLMEATSTGDRLPQRMAGNTVTGNTLSGVYVDLQTGTMFQGDIVGNTVSQNGGIGIQVRSHSFGLGNDLPLDPGTPFALPGLQDISFNVNIGTGAAGDGNTLHQNKGAGIAIETLDYGTGSFEIRDNVITATVDDNNPATAYKGEGIAVRLEKDIVSAESVALLAKSIIDGNTIGVDNLGNQGNGLLFTMGDRTRIQDLNLTNNTFLNNKLDGFHFERRQDADLSNVVISKNRATNNGSDGISIYATNTTRDLLDFTITENIVNDNNAYGVRLDVATDARVGIEFSQNSVTGNGDLPNGTGYHPKTDGTGNTGSAGGIGLLAFQQAVVKLTGTDNIVDGNIGDGFSVDAFNFFDSLKFDMNLSNTTFNNNTLTGFRSHGTSFGTFVWTANQFSSNGEDGVRFAAIDDKNDFYERRVGGQDISIRSLQSHFDSNGANGARLGQGVSAAFGDGTDPNANFFDLNGADGLKITQSAGAYMAQQNSTVAGAGLAYEFRRHIGASRNYFRNNAGDGIDIGHFAQTEGGNVELGDEVITDTHVSVNSAIVTGNGGDGIEYLADSILRLSPVIGGGQDGFDLKHNSSLSVSNSRISGNTKRGIDILNRVGEDSAISIINNQIFSNKGEAIYVLNTASHLQLQNASSDPLDVFLEPTTRSDDDTRFFSVGTKQREVEWEISPNIELRVQDNVIQSNGSQTGTSTVPVTLSPLTNDNAALPSTDWTHSYQQVAGTLGGLVIRVGAVDSAGRTTNFGTGNQPLPIPPAPFIDYLNYTSNPNWELGLSGIDAEVFRNSFDGNVGADVYTDSFTSQVPRKTIMNVWNPTEGILWPFDGYRDPLARLNMSFRENTGNSLDLTNGFAFLDNWEFDYKRRNIDPLDPPGNFSGTGFFRNQTRTIGRWKGFPSFGNAMGDDFTNEIYYNEFFTKGGVFVGNYSYDGLGTSTFRVESDFNTSSFGQTSPALGFSDFYDALDISINNANIQWDTGKNVGSFVGDTPWSLDRGDIFNVRDGQNPIVGDSLEENDSFIGATDLGVVAGTFSVNAEATNNRLSLHTKRDRDYYSFVAGGTGSIDVNVGNTDATGDRVVYMLYEIDPDANTEENALLKAANGDAQFVVVGTGGTGVLTANVVAGRRYAIEVFSDESENVVSSIVKSDPISNSGKLAKFHYGTVRSYTISMDAPALSAFAPLVASASSSVTGPSGSGTTGTTSAAAPASISLPGAPVATFVAVTADPRTTAVPSITLNFNEDVTGVDLADFTLMRGATQIALNAASGVVLTQISPSQYSMSLGKVTGAAGTYTLTLIASTSGIKDTTNTALIANAVDSWTVTNSVNVLTDSLDAVVGDGDAKDSNGKRSLRAAVMESNATAGDDLIQLAAGTYTLTLGGRGEDDAAGGDLDITGNVVIRGNSPRTTFISIAQLDRIFQIFVGASLTLENLTLQGGAEFDGGAIFNDGTLVLKNVNVIDNEAYNQGGGIYNTGSLTVTGSSISENLAGSRGGAVHNLGTSSYLNTTVSTNTAVSRGGGIFNEGTATATMINMTIANNAAGSRGGGIANESSNATLIGNSILERNRTDARVPATNASTNKELMGGVHSLGYNSIQVLDARYASGTAAGLLTSDKFGRDAAPRAEMTNVLQYGQGNGVGFHALKLNGGAVDTGSNSVYPVNPLGQFDAISNPRLIKVNGDDRPVTIDLGAVEYLVNTPIALFVATPNPAGLNEVITFNGSKSKRPNPAAGSIVSWEWDFDWNPDNIAPTRPLTDPTYNPYERFTLDATGVSSTHAYTNVNRTSYIVRLIVTDNFGNKGFIDKVVTIGKPTKPVILRPFAVTSDLTPTITWQGSPATYRLRVDNVTTNQDNIINVDNLTTTTYTPPSNLTPGQYRVIVTATNGSGSTASNAYFFDITRLALTSPVGATFDVTPFFKWADVPGSSRYDIWVNRVQPSSQETVIRNQFVTSNSYEAQVSLGAGTFTWWVRAYDADDAVGDWSLPKTFTIGRPSFTAPATVTMNTRPTFTWTNMGSPRYELWVNQVGGTNKIIYEPALTTNSYTPPTALPNGTFDVWVRAIAADGEAGLWSFSYRFRMDYRVGPETISPSGVTTDTTPTFKWKVIDGAATYDLRVNNTSTGAINVIRVTVPHINGASTITYTPAVLLPAGNYNWSVQAVTAGGARSAWSVDADFLIPVPSIITPRGSITTSTPQFTWNGVAEFKTYELWVNNLSTNLSQVIYVRGLTSKSYTPTLPLEDGSFRAWVRGFDKDGLPSQWSAFSDFKINATIGTAPIALQPNTTIDDRTPTFTWTSVANAAKYEILVKNLTDGGQPVVLNITDIAGLNYTTTTTLAPNKNYRWWVRAITANNSPGPWSQPKDFRVVSSDLPLTPDSDSPFGSAQLASVVFTAYAENGIDDQVRSITAHPAGTVVQLTAEAAARFQVESDEAIQYVDPVDQIDAVMEELALDSFFMAGHDTETILPIVAVTPAPVVTGNADAEKITLDAVTAGLLAAIAMPRTVPDKDNKRQSQG